MLKAAKMLQKHADAIDINFGCPQGIAKRGHYGAFLLEELQLVRRIVRTLSQGLDIPLFCKIRILDTWEATEQLVRAIEEEGCQLLAVHGRTKEQIKLNITPADWDTIKKIKEII